MGLSVRIFDRIDCSLKEEESVGGSEVCVKMNVPVGARYWSKSNKIIRAIGGLY